MTISPDHRCFNFSCSHVIDLCLDLIDRCFDLPHGYWEFVTGLYDSIPDLVSIIELSCLVFLDDTQRFCLYLLISCKKRFPHSSHCLLLRIALLSSAGLESTTLEFSLPQYGHLIFLYLRVFYCLKYIIFFCRKESFFFLFQAFFFVDID